MEVGEVFVDVGGVDAHLVGAVAYPSHLFSQRVALGGTQGVDRGTRRRSQSSGCTGQIRSFPRNHIAHSIHELAQLGSCVQIVSGFPQEIGTGCRIVGVSGGSEDVFLLNGGVQHDVIPVPGHDGILVVHGKKPGGPDGKGSTFIQSIDQVRRHQHHVFQVIIRAQAGVARHVGKHELGSISDGDGIRRDHGGAKGIRLVQVIHEFRGGTALEVNAVQIQGRIGVSAA